jgi:HKD family nuclease
MQFISNGKSSNHFKEINSLIEQSEEVYIATAFLKSSGLDKILPSLKKAIKEDKTVVVIAGQHFALTEPKALYTLRKLFLPTVKGKLHIAHAINSSEVFHPKLFLFRSGAQFSLLTGSANVTEGGFSSNIECSLLIRGDVQDSVWKEAMNFYKILLSPEMSEEASLLSISRYESFYEAQKNHNRQAKAIPNRKKSQQEFNYLKLKEHFKRFNSAKRNEAYVEKVGHYKEARKVLNAIADAPRLTQASFAPLLDQLVGSEGEDRWWHSGSLFRLRRKVYPYYREFQQLVRFIRGNIHLKPAQLFTKSKELVKPIEGASVNYLTEIMMTYDPNTFANMNKNPITVLRNEGNVYIKATSASFSGDDYEVYCELVAEICQKLELRGMLEADSFFNEIYWKIYKKSKA